MKHTCRKMRQRVRAGRGQAIIGYVDGKRV
jgi:hypothetical protein